LRLVALDEILVAMKKCRFFLGAPVVARDVPRSYRRTVAGIDIRFLGLDGLVAQLGG
jgi:hypothetical protein